MRFFRLKPLIKLVVAFAVVFAIAMVFVPVPEFKKDYATLLLSDNGKFLSAVVSDDEQWRFEPLDSVPYQFKVALINFEDRYFYKHVGVNPVSIVRAFKQNIAAGGIVSGGSTITMQVARMSRGNRERSYKQKLIEILMAVKLELFKSKNDILNIYATNAPFGGNVVGLEAASWRYFQRSPYELSWAESAMLAVLPNAPSLVYPGKNSDVLKEKRNKLLEKLYHLNYFDEFTLELAKAEKVPDAIHNWVNLSPHLLQRLKQDKGSGRYNTAISYQIQKNANRIAEDFHKIYAGQGINNLAAMVLDVRTMQVKAYVGNCIDTENKNGGDVDIIQSSRSSGSILKPFLYAAALEEGVILPSSLLPDIPTYMGGFVPQNFNMHYDGLVPANQALVRSLNIPFVMLLKDYGANRFYHNLQSLGFYNFSLGPDHYGLSMILGGGEVTLWQLAGAYGSMAKMLCDGQNNFALYEPVLLSQEKPFKKGQVQAINAGSAYITLSNLLDLERPDEESGWHFFTSSKKIAWKTGTSFGFRDAWALGVTPDYLVAVWVGNADGQGISGLTGTSKAAPLMFRIFDFLKEDGTYFKAPFEALTYVPVCHQSGNLLSPYCVEVDTVLIPENSKVSQVCNYHQIVHLSKDGNYRVNAQCYPVTKMKHEKFFVVPVQYIQYVKNTKLGIKELPPYHKHCKPDNNIKILYPQHNQKLYLPIDFDGKQNAFVAEASINNNLEALSWFVDEKYYATTYTDHRIGLNLSLGDHKISVCDMSGNDATILVEVLSGENKH